MGDRVFGLGRNPPADLLVERLARRQNEEKAVEKRVVDRSLKPVPLAEALSGIVARAGFHDLPSAAPLFQPYGPELALRDRRSPEGGAVDRGARRRAFRE